MMLKTFVGHLQADAYASGRLALISMFEIAFLKSGSMIVSTCG
jgi:predicted ribonuclease toxin of YeeF-YezG toxin-antitoxin module